MIFLALLIGGVSAAALLLAGFQLGLSRGAKVRDELHGRLEEGSVELRSQLYNLARILQKNEDIQQTLKQDMQQYLGARPGGPTETQRMRAELESILEPIMERDQANDQLQSKMHELLGPLMQRERLGYDLAQLDLGTGQRQELPRLLDSIAETGGFSVVLLSDDAGLPLAASSGTENPERYAGLSSLLVALMERLSREPGPAPQAVVVYNTADQQLLSRAFEVSGQRLMLTAVASGSSLSPIALDPALAKLGAILSPSTPLLP